MKIDNSEIALRPALRADLDLLEYWDEQPHVIAAAPNSDWQWQNELGRQRDWRQQLIAELDGKPIGYIEIIDPAREEKRYWGDVEDNLRAIDIWIGEAACLGKGYGSAMMTLAIERCFAEDDVAGIVIDPLSTNTRAHRFYQRLGFRFVEIRVFGEDECRVYRLNREHWRRGA